jgi:hypothetical protein
MARPWIIQCWKFFLMSISPDEVELMMQRTCVARSALTGLTTTGLTLVKENLENAEPRSRDRPRRTETRAEFQRVTKESYDFLGVWQRHPLRPTIDGVSQRHPLRATIDGASWTTQPGGGGCERSEAKPPAVNINAHARHTVEARQGSAR